MSLFCLFIQKCVAAGLITRSAGAASRAGLLACITAASKQAAVEVVMPAAAPQQATAAGLITHPKTGIAAIAAPVAAFLGRSTAALAAAAAAVPSAAASTRAPVEVVMPEAAPQQAGLLLPTSAAYGSLPAASALPAVPAPRAAALPATAAFPSTAVPAATQQPLPAAGIYQPVQQSRPTLAAQSAPGLALPAGVPMSAAPQTYQPFPAASSGLTAAANPGFPPMAPGGFGALPAAYSGPLPGDGVMGRGKHVMQLSSLLLCYREVHAKVFFANRISIDLQLLSFPKQKLHSNMI